MLTTKTGTTATCTWGGFLTALTGFEVGVGSSTSSEFSFSAFSPILGFVPCFTASSSREPMSSFFTCTTTREFTFRGIFSLTSQCQCSLFCSPAPPRWDRAPQAQQQHQAFYPRSSPDRERINSEKNQENILKVSQYLFQQLVLGSKVEHKLLVSLLSLRARLGVKEMFPAFITLYCSPAGGTRLVPRVFVGLPHQVLGQRLARFQILFGGRGNGYELALGEVVLSRKVEPCYKLVSIKYFQF